MALELGMATTGPAILPASVSSGNLVMLFPFGWQLNSGGKDQGTTFTQQYAGLFFHIARTRPILDCGHNNNADIEEMSDSTGFKDGVEFGPYQWQVLLWMMKRETDTAD